MILEAGQSDLRFSRPSIEIQLADVLGPLTVKSFTRLAHDDWDSQRFEVSAQVSKTASLSAQYFSGTQGHGKDTMQLVGKLRLSETPFTLTSSYSPDAFGFGPRYRVGGQVYKRFGDVSVWAWGTVRYQSRFDKWTEEHWYSLSYHLDDQNTVSIRRFDSDVFGDNITLRFKHDF